jgi:hypothetical protein
MSDELWMVDDLMEIFDILIKAYGQLLEFISRHVLVVVYDILCTYSTSFFSFLCLHS